MRLCCVNYRVCRLRGIMTIAQRGWQRPPVPWEGRLEAKAAYRSVSLNTERYGDVDERSGGAPGGPWAQPGRVARRGVRGAEFSDEI